MLLGEKYRLELHWGKVTCNTEGVVILDKCYFCGPVVKEVSKLEEIDSMSLDFQNQFIVFIQSYYIGKLSWNGVYQTYERIDIKNVLFANKHINAIPLLKDNDYILIDTNGHVDEKHQFNLTYPSYLLREDGESYVF